MFGRKFAIVAIILLFSSAAVASVWQVSVKGSEVYSENFLIGQLDLPQEMDVISPERRDFIINFSKGNLDDFYQNSGYFSAKINLIITTDEIDSITTQNYLFEVYEGKRYEFRNVKMNMAPSSDSLEVKSLNVVDGGFYDSEKITYDLKLIRETYRRRGYLHITVEHLEYIDTTDKKVDVEYFINPKNQLRMGTFKTVTYRSGHLPGHTSLEPGLSDTAWVSKLWQIPKDSVISGRYYNSFRTKLFSTQLFSQIQLEDTLRNDGLSDITLTAYERIPGDAGYTVFYEQVYGFGLMYSTRHRNFTGVFNEWGGSALIAQNKQEISLNYANPLFLGVSFIWLPTAIRFDNRLSFNHENLPIPNNPNRQERWEIINRGDLSFGLTRRTRSRNSLDFRLLQEEGEKRFKAKFEPGLIFDFTDNSYDPVLGIRVTPSLGIGMELQNENLEKIDINIKHVFGYFDGTYSFYFPLLKHLNNAFAFSCGKMFNKASKDDAQMFYQGGGRTLRGYGFRTVFPYKYDENDSIVGGESPMYFRINEELRFNLPMKFQLVPFIDWARVEDSDSSFEMVSQTSVGLGVRYKWQFLTVRLDYALKTEFEDWKPEKFSWSRFVFDLSQAF